MCVFYLSHYIYLDLSMCSWENFNGPMHMCP